MFKLTIHIVVIIFRIEDVLFSRKFDVKFWYLRWLIKNEGQCEWKRKPMANQHCDSRAYSRYFLGATIASNLVPRVWIKMFSLEMVENDIYLGGTSVPSRSKMIAVNHYRHPKKCPQKWSREGFFIYINV